VNEETKASDWEEHEHKEERQPIDGRHKDEGGWLIDGWTTINTWSYNT
jgi:hypothetical protein